MRRLPVFCLLFILAMLQFSSVDAQKLADEWRVIKKVRTETNGQQYGFEYTYNQDGTIKTVKYLTATGALSLIINNFNFNRNNKPISYTLQYNNGSKTSVVLKYDNQGRITEVEKVFDNQTTIFNYRYSGTAIIVTEQTSNSSNTLKGNKINFYTEQGNYNETSSDAATQIITSKITLKKSANRELDPHLDNFMGGWEAPDFLGVVAFATEPEITATKNEYDLITTLTWVNRTGTRKNEYTYAKIKNSEPLATIPVENIPVTIITTNINCAAGKEIVERILKSQDGVQSVKVDIRTGKLSLAYSSYGTPYSEIIKLINEAGFNADRIKSTSPDKNPCKQPEPKEQTISITIQTNINCDEGKRKVESFLKEQNGVISATADTRSGKLVVEYNKVDISTEVINRILSSAGFDADRKKSTSPDKNPCIKKAEPVEKPTSVTLQTNINCTEGKQKIESLLKEQTGVLIANVDFRSGKLEMEYSKKEIASSQIIRLINQAGFDVEDAKSKNPENNPCKKPEPVEKPVSVTLQTNINCVDGKQKIESLLKEQTGVLIANVDFRSGKLEMEYSKKSIVSSQIMRLINQAGFDVEKTKSITPENNPCNKKPIDGGDKPYVVKPLERVPDEVAQPKFSTVQGKLFYRYKKEGEQPVSNPLNMPVISITSDGSTSGKISYPDFIAAQRFPKTTDKGTQPLKNAKISLVYTTLSPKQITPTRFEDFPYPGFRPHQNDPLNKYYLLATNDPVIATGVTDKNGNFSFTFYNSLALGYLGSFGGFEITSDADRKVGLAGDFHMYGALRIIINEGYYYSPDILLFPKPGKTTNIPDELGLVKSFDLTVTVKSDRKVLDQAVGTGVPISSYPINIGRLQNKLSGEVPSNPFEARELEIGVKTDKTTNGDTYKVFDQGITDGNGQIIFQNLSILNDHVIQAIENKFDGSFVYKKQDQPHLYQNSQYIGDYNSTAVTGKNSAEMLLMPKLPELYVTTQAKVNGKTIALEDVDVTMYSYYKAIDGKKEEQVTQNLKTKDGGHLQVKDLPVQTTKEKNDKGKIVERVTGPERRLILNKSGYHTMIMPNTMSGTTLQLGQRWPGTIIYMKGRAKLTGRIENESGQGVAAEIKVADGPSVKTTRVFNHDGYFFLDNATTGNKITVLITPVVDQYFADTITIDLPEGKATDLGRIKLKEKLHRVIFKIIDENKKPVVDA